MGLHINLQDAFVSEREDTEELVDLKQGLLGEQEETGLKGEDRQRGVGPQQQSQRQGAEVGSELGRDTGRGPQEGGPGLPSSSEEDKGLPPMPRTSRAGGLMDAGTAYQVCLNPCQVSGRLDQRCNFAFFELVDGNTLSAVFVLCVLQ